MSYGAKNYKQTQIMTASPAQLIILLYEGALTHLHKAIAAIEKKDIPAKCKAITRVHDIVIELNTSLNHEVGGEISRELERLYNFMGEQLIKANAENSIEALKTVQKNLETLLEGWREAVKSMNSKTA
jgi:flagellar protein FliS